MKDQLPLEIKNLAAGYDKPLFENLNLTIEPRQFVTIMGENGSGKTTLLDCLMGLTRPLAGEIRFWSMKNESAERVEIQRKVGWVSSQAEAFPPWVRLKEMLGAIAPLYPTWDENLCRSLAEQMQLDLNKRVGHLSLGEASKFRLIKSIAFQPRLLVLDELTANLSPDSKQIMIETLLSQFASTELSVLYICHSNDEAIRLSDRMYVLGVDGLTLKQGGLS